MKVDALKLAQDLMRCPSVTPDDHGALDTLQGVLEKLGFACTRLPFSDTNEPTVDNLYARIGTEKPFLCFAGHTDVVPPGDEKAWSVPPFSATVKDGVLIGRGASDMKAAIACMAAAVAQYLEGGKLKGSIGFIITGDEEGHAINGTRKMVDWMEARGEIPDACIVGEPTNPERIGDMVKIGRRGSLSMKLTVKGQQGHVAYPHLADNPVTKIVDILHEFKHKTIDTGTEYFPASNLEVTSIDVGNPVKNVIPAQAMAFFNIRYNDLHHSKDMLKWLDEVCAQHAPGGYKLDVITVFEPFITMPGALSTKISDAVEAATGKKPELSTTGGTSDARFIRHICPVVEFGAINKTAHMTDENIRVDDVQLLAECYLEILKHYFGQ